jgi:hypothetical protein
MCDGTRQNPLIFRKLPIVMRQVLLSLTVAFFAVSWCPVEAREVDLGKPVQSTPYDKYLGPMRDVLGRLGANHPTMPLVNGWVREGRGFRYSFTEPYVPQLPEVTERLRAGDCKAKSLWLANEMNDRTVRFVVGKYTRSAEMSHAWLLWENQGRWYVLDATMKSSAIDLANVSENDWVPLFSYSARGKFQHEAASTMADREHPDPIGGSLQPRKLAASEIWWAQPWPFHTFYTKLP